MENIQQQPNFIEEKSPTPLPDNPHWNWASALLIWIVSVFLIVLFPTIAFFLYAAFQGLDLKDRQLLAETQLNDPTAIIYSISAIIPAHLLTLLIAWALVTKFGKISFRDALGWKWNGFNVWMFLSFIGAFYILAAFFSLILPSEDNDTLRILRSSRTAVFVMAFMATFTAPLVEEVIYRGVLFSAFLKRFGVNYAVGIVTLIFAAVHYPQYYPSFASIIMITILSLAITWIRVKSGNLLPCIALHMLFNASQAALLIAEPWLKSLTEKEPIVSKLFP